MSQNGLCGFSFVWNTIFKLYSWLSLSIIVSPKSPHFTPLPSALSKALCLLKGGPPQDFCCLTVRRDQNETSLLGILSFISNLETLFFSECDEFTVLHHLPQAKLQSYCWCAQRKLSHWIILMGPFKGVTIFGWAQAEHKMCCIYTGAVRGEIQTRPGSGARLRKALIPLYVIRCLEHESTVRKYSRQMQGCKNIYSPMT